VGVSIATSRSGAVQGGRGLAQRPCAATSMI